MGCGEGWGGGLVIGVSETSQPQDLPEPSFSPPFPSKGPSCGKSGRRVGLQPQESTFPERGGRVWGGGLRGTPDLRPFGDVGRS